MSPLSISFETSTMDFFFTSLLSGITAYARAYSCFMSLWLFGMYHKMLMLIRRPSPSKILKSVETCTSVWPFSTREI